ncbi:DUF4190 domain-containing protein [Streptomyces poonensis]|uniref:Membrane protein n=1 Tax=Streptomyces poonensis TaxID=68255 RepID=A0A918P899_9ACTN|nr:DUF4190 domain-containing protein [Streptomyces poonensis]GGY90180.1 membrane protein [Streptomyces poonensis]GLJ87991.1 membrane protein [Streptomyces poonensis]
MAIPPPPGPQQPDGQNPPPQGQYPPPPGPYPPPGQPYPYQHPHPPQPWPQSYAPYGSLPPVNGFAIGALVLGVLCFVPLVGMILGTVALVQIRKKGERGKGMAVSGMVLSLAGTLLLVVSLATGGGRAFWEDFGEAVRESGSTFSVDKGECFDAPGGSLEGYAYDVDEVPCDGEHHAEVFAGFQLPDGKWPGEDEITEVADDRCYTLAGTYAMDYWAWPADVDVYYFLPTRDSWGLGDREITCMFGSVDGTSTLTGSLRTDETMLDADQLAYLEADALLYEALATAPEEEYVEDALEEHKAWASRLDKALGEQIAMLRGHAWPAAADGPVAGHVKALESAREEWAEAARVSDADAFYEHYGTGGFLLEGTPTVTARKALGLATTPPVYGEGAAGEYEEEDGGRDGLGTEV